MCSFRHFARLSLLVVEVVVYVAQRLTLNMANSLSPPQTFDLKGGNVKTPRWERWTKWKLSLYIYLESKEIHGAEEKRDMLLIFGGPQLRDIVYNLPGALVSPSEGVDIFETAIKKLDEYFKPNKFYERYLFHQLKQEDGERFLKFVIKLSNQAEKCKFSKSFEENLISQIYEKCSSIRLRHKILTLGENVTLNRIILEAKALETTDSQTSTPLQTNILEREERISRLWSESYRLIHSAIRRTMPQKRNFDYLLEPNLALHLRMDAEDLEVIKVEEDLKLHNLKGSKRQN